MLIGEHHPDVAVLHIKMPKISGIEVTCWMRSHCQDIGILILTAYDDEPCLVSALQAGANGYVLKTASPFEMIQAVQDVMKGNQPCLYRSHKNWQGTFPTWQTRFRLTHYPIARWISCVCLPKDVQTERWARSWESANARSKITLRIFSKKCM